MELTHFNKAKNELVLATSIDEVKDIRNKAEALRAYAKQAGESLDMQNQCAEIKIRAERRAGELIPEQITVGTKSHDVTLSDLDISNKQSSRWQAIASVSEDDFEGHIAKTKGSKNELTSIGVYKLAKKARIYQANEKTTSEACAVSDLHALIESGQKFGTIYADPPWAYSNQATRASTDNHYSTMSPDEIAELPIAELSPEKAHLHLWTTNAFLFECPAILEKWGFEYKGIFLWVKPQIGMGNYWRVSHEFMVLGVKGSLTFRDKSQPSWIEHQRTQHSVKPEKVAEIIEKTSPGPYLELFGRCTRPGWVTWGNEIERTLFNGQAFG